MPEFDLSDSESCCAGVMVAVTPARMPSMVESEDPGTARRDDTSELALEQLLGLPAPKPPQPLPASAPVATAGDNETAIVPAGMEGQLVNADLPPLSYKSLLEEHPEMHYKCRRFLPRAEVEVLYQVVGIPRALRRAEWRAFVLAQGGADPEATTSGSSESDTESAPAQDFVARSDTDTRRGSSAAASDGAQRSRRHRSHTRARRGRDDDRDDTTQPADRHRSRDREHERHDSSRKRSRSAERAARRRHGSRDSQRKRSSSRTPAVDKHRSRSRTHDEPSLSEQHRAQRRHRAEKHGRGYRESGDRGADPVQDRWRVSESATPVGAASNVSDHWDGLEEMGAGTPDVLLATNRCGFVLLAVAL